ncbi:mitochondrial inner membrane protein [Leucosporidium creatinivorum]|uniref:Mitochondrial aspartate-glutamate transporter AGC1 n=1 Tax=Leucosporidium creatinivorum TaxID=106004 RepID=A0A1Y2EMI1_9BASI|nr:mitochondrial inner membrane protein [Leucosporidium creatinivorum]
MFNRSPLLCKEQQQPVDTAALKKPTPPGFIDAPEPTQAELNKWRKTFEQFATADSAEEGKYLSETDFVSAIAPTGDFAKIGRQQYGILFHIADQRKRGKVTWEDFVAFETTLKRPDAEFDIAFKFFDSDGSGDVSFDEFKRVFSENLPADSIPFNFDAAWVKLYLGKVGGSHVLGYNEFTQLMKGLQGERLRQAFHYFDKDQTGYISPADFQRIIKEIAAHKLSDTVLESVPSLATLTPGGKITYSECIAFYNVIRDMDIVEKIVREACAQSPDGKISPLEFTNHASRAMRYSTFSPMEVSIIFHYAGKGEGKRLRLRDFAQLLDPKWGPPKEVIHAEPTKTGSFLHETGKSSYYFFLGGIAGALGATTVYPIDLVKTRMQNQRSKVVGELLYKNSIDCVKKVYKNEGFLGFYRGLPPQLIGVAPEKAIKLTVNDLVRGYATNPETGRISVPWELVAGGAAGGCQVVFTNPLEIVKIRLQMQGQAPAVPGAIKTGAGHIIKQLGLIGLYKGATACLCRDVPFSAIYFPAYAHLKKDIFHEGKDGKVLGYGEALAAAAIAGMPAAYMTTPADVIKTRLQTEARKGETHYKGVLDAFRKILAEEGPRALFKGGPARVLRSSPQFGVTLVAYENLKKQFPYPKPETSITDLLPAQQEDLSRIRARNALKVLLDAQTSFGAK